MVPPVIKTTFVKKFSSLDGMMSWRPSIFVSNYYHHIYSYKYTCSRGFPEAGSTTPAEKKEVVPGSVRLGVVGEWRNHHRADAMAGGPLHSRSVDQDQG